jgi:hypothetical protein
MKETLEALCHGLEFHGATWSRALAGGLRHTCTWMNCPPGLFGTTLKLALQALAGLLVRP